MEVRDSLEPWAYRRGQQDKLVSLYPQAAWEPVCCTQRTSEGSKGHTLGWYCFGQHCTGSEVRAGHLRTNQVFQTEKKKNHLCKLGSGVLFSNLCGEKILLSDTHRKELLSCWRPWQVSLQARVSPPADVGREGRATSKATASSTAYSAQSLYSV